MEANEIASVVTEEWSALGEEPVDDFVEEAGPTTGSIWAWRLAAVAALLPAIVVLWATLHALS